MAKKNSRLDSLLKKINKSGLVADFLSKNSLSNATEFIDTGSYALNGIISGSLFGGIPTSRVTGLAGPSGCGKTMLCLKIVKNAQKMGYTVFYFDSENALDFETANRIGCDTDNILYVPCTTIENTQSKISQVLQDAVDQNKEVDETGEGEKAKYFVVIDSLGNLPTEKELNNSLDNSVAGDMGARAKALGVFLRVVTNLSAASRAVVLFTNHVYQNPGAMYPTLVQNQSGGQKVLYLASVLVQISQVLNRTKDFKDDVRSKLAEKTVGRRLHMLVTKNRFVVPELECDLTLNYKTGLDPYSGLLDLAVMCGYIKNRGAYYYMGDTNIGHQADFDNKEFWDAHLNELDDIVKKETALSEDDGIAPIEYRKAELSGGEDQEN